MAEEKVVAFTGHPISSAIQLDLKLEAANYVVSNVSLAAFGMQHCWRNISAEYGTNVFSFTVSSNAVDTAIAVTVPDGEYTIDALCATIESLLATNYNLDGAGADTQTWTMEANGVLSSGNDTLTAKGGNNPFTGLVHFNLSNNVALAGALTITINNTALSRMLGFYAREGDVATTGNSATTTLSKCTVSSVADYDVRFAAIHPSIMIQLEGISQGAVINQLASKTSLDKNSYPLLGIVPLTNVAFQEPVVYDNTRVNMAPRAVQTSNTLRVKFSWEDGSPVNFPETAQVFLQLLIVHEPLLSLSNKRTRFE